MYSLDKDGATEVLRERDADKIEQERQTMNKYGYFSVENDVIAEAENAVVQSAPICAGFQCGFTRKT